MEQATMTSAATNPGPTYGKELCLLSLDGGGVRGLSSLQILKLLMESINPESPPKPCDYFDMIGGTSTGGLIALMLGRLRMSVDDCIAAYTDLSSQIFTQLHHRLTWKGEVQGRFDHKALEAGVKAILVQQGLGEDALLRDPSSSACKTFVCATSKQTSKTVVLSSYFSRRRGSDMLHSAKVWEAARATSAASSFFDSIEINDEEFVDGATRSNNPINAIWTEASDTWRDGDDWKLEENVKCVVSIGTGIPSLKPFGDDPINIGKTLLAIATDTETLAEDFQRLHTNLYKEHRYFRFNVLRGLENIGLEDASKKKEIRAATREYVQTETVFNQLEACALNLNEREWLKQFVEEARRDARRTLESLGTAQTSRADPNSLAWFTNTSDYDWWLHSAGSLLWYPAPLSLSRPSDTRFSVSLCKHLLENAKLAMGSEICVIFHRCSRDTETSFDANIGAPERIADAAVEAAAVLWSLIGQVLVAGHSSNEEIHASVYRLRRVDRELLKKRIGTGQRISLELLIRLLRSVLSMSVFPKTVILIEEIENMARPQIFDFLTKIRQMLNEMASSSQIHALISGTPVEEVKKALNGVRVFAEDTEYRECLRSLEFVGIFSRRDQVTHAEDGTNEWIWLHPEYRAWEKDESSILWIQGKPGSGKSVLAKSIQERLSSLPQGDHSAARNMLFTRSVSPSVGGWFYHGRGGAVGISHRSMLQSILYQLLGQDRSLFQYYKDTYRKLRRAGTGHCEWSTEQLEAVLSRMAAAGDEAPEILCVVDGMDESEDVLGHYRSRQQILSLFSSLVNESRIKMIVLSRPARAIEREFRHCHHIILEAENQTDIKRVVDAGLRSLLMSMQSFDSSDEEAPPITRRTNRKRIEVHSPRKPIKPRIFNKVRNSEQAELDFIRVYLLEHAQGVILWVTLMMSELKRHVEKGMYTFKELREQLLGLPLRLNNVYERIVEDLDQRHNEADRTKARRILAWVIGASARQALQLKELLDALAIPSDLEASLESEDDPIVANRPRIRSWNHFRRSLYELCGPLVEVISPAKTTPDGDFDRSFDVGPSSVVQLLHQTVKDFLANRQSAKLFYIKPSDAEWIVSRDGRQYLQLSFPLAPTPYAPQTVAGESGWEENFEEVVYYLEDKFLLTFVLNKPLLDPYFGLVGVNNTPESTKVMLSAFLEPTPYDALDSSQTAISSPVGRYFWFTCSHGLVTAVENLLAMGSLYIDWWKNFQDAVLGGILVAAVDCELFTMVKSFTTLHPYVGTPIFMTNFLPLIDRAVITGNEEITMFLYDLVTTERSHISEPSTISEIQSRNPLDEPDGRAKCLARVRAYKRSPQPDDLVKEVNEAIVKVLTSWLKSRPIWDSKGFFDDNWRSKVVPAPTSDLCGGNSSSTSHLLPVLPDGSPPHDTPETASTPP